MAIAGFDQGAAGSFMIDARHVDAAAWLPLDLARLRGELWGVSASRMDAIHAALAKWEGVQHPAETPPTLDEAGAGSPVAARPEPRAESFAIKLVRVPAEAFVVIGRAAGEPPVRRPVRIAATVGANDNALDDAAKPAFGLSRRVRSALRQALFLVMLGLSLYGAYHTGQTHARQIVVPGPMGFYSVVTSLEAPPAPCCRVAKAGGIGG